MICLKFANAGRELSNETRFRTLTFEHTLVTLLISFSGMLSPYGNGWSNVCKANSGRFLSSHFLISLHNISATEYDWWYLWNVEIRSKLHIVRKCAYFTQIYYLKNWSLFRWVKAYHMAWSVTDVQPWRLKTLRFLQPVCPNDSSGNEWFLPKNTSQIMKWKLVISFWLNNKHTS